MEVETPRGVLREQEDKPSSHTTRGHVLGKAQPRERGHSGKLPEDRSWGMREVGSTRKGAQGLRRASAQECGVQKPGNSAQLRNQVFTTAEAGRARG